MHHRNPTRRKKKVPLWRRCLNDKTAVDVREEQQVTDDEDGGAEDKSNPDKSQELAENSIVLPGPEYQPRD